MSYFLLFFLLKRGRFFISSISSLKFPLNFYVTHIFLKILLKKRKNIPTPNKLSKHLHPLHLISQQKMKKETGHTSLFPLFLIVSNACWYGRGWSFYVKFVISKWSSLKFLNIVFCLKISLRIFFLAACMHSKKKKKKKRKKEKKGESDF